MSVEMSVEVASRQVDLPREAPSWAYAGAGRSRNSSVRNVIPIMAESLSKPCATGALPFLEPGRLGYWAVGAGDIWP